MENISWNDLMKNEEEIHRVNEERNIILKIKGKKDKWKRN
jgi:hypothetical protein